MRLKPEQIKPARERALSFTKREEGLHTFKELEIPSIFLVILSILKDLQTIPHAPIKLIAGLYNLFHNAYEQSNSGVSALIGLTKQKITADLTQLASDLKTVDITKDTLKFWQEIEFWLSVYHHTIYVQVKKDKQGKIIVNEDGSVGPIDFIEDRAFHSKTDMYKYDVALLYLSAAKALQGRMVTFAESQKIESGQNNQPIVLAAEKNLMKEEAYSGEIRVQTSECTGYTKVDVSLHLLPDEAYKVLLIKDALDKIKVGNLAAYLSQFKDESPENRFNVLMGALGNFPLSKLEAQYLENNKLTIVSGLQSYINSATLFNMIHAKATEECKTNIPLLDGVQALRSLFEFWHSVKGYNSKTIGPICEKIFTDVYEHLSRNPELEIQLRGSLKVGGMTN